MIPPLNHLWRILCVRPQVLGLTRFSSSFVSRMRFLNRLKQDDKACAAALQDGQLVLFHRLQPLLQRAPTGTFRPVTLTYSGVQSLLQKFGSDGPLLEDSILIGCSEQNQAQFCLDVGHLDQAAVAEFCAGTFIDLRKSFFLLLGPAAQLVAKAQALLRWHQTSGFCSATGQPTYRNRAGSQRVCSSSSIIYYPKMSPVVIVLLSDGSRCLLGRQASFPRGMYSALAGFCDMGETLEEALHREVAEEVGLEVLDVSYSSSQHWPFPHSSFMLGCHATVSPTHTQVSLLAHRCSETDQNLSWDLPQLDVDRSELEDARWFTLEEISCALQAGVPPRGSHPPDVWLPPKHAVAHHLITEWRDRQRHLQASA